MVVDKILYLAHTHKFNTKSNRLNMTRRLEFEPYRLSNLRVTNEQLGTGSYASVLKVEYISWIGMCRKTNPRYIATAERYD